jgi:hypothetical protein
MDPEGVEITRVAFSEPFVEVEGRGSKARRQLIGFDYSKAVFGTGRCKG